MLTLAQAADLTGALAAYKLALAEERIVELKGRSKKSPTSRSFPPTVPTPFPAPSPVLAFPA